MKMFVKRIQWFVFVCFIFLILSGCQQRQSIDVDDLHQLLIDSNWEIIDDVAIKEDLEAFFDDKGCNSCEVLHAVKYSLYDDFFIILSFNSAKAQSLVERNIGEDDRLMISPDLDIYYYQDAIVITTTAYIYHLIEQEYN